MHILIQLHKNESFNVHQSMMKEALHCLCTPPRKERIDIIVKSHSKVTNRLKDSLVVERRMQASYVISRIVHKWFAEIRVRNSIKAAILAEKKRQEDLDALENQADEHGY